MAKAPTEIKSLARSHTETALATLAGIMRQENAPPHARVAAATALLDRGWGRPEQSMELTGDIQQYVALMPVSVANLAEWRKLHMTDETVDNAKLIEDQSLTEH